MQICDSYSVEVKHRQENGCDYFRIEEGDLVLLCKETITSLYTELQGKSLDLVIEGFDWRVKSADKEPQNISREQDKIERSKSNDNLVFGDVDYGAYTKTELYEAMEYINEELYPERLKAIKSALANC